jgi:hypothetical protein
LALHIGQAGQFVSLAFTNRYRLYHKESMNARAFFFFVRRVEKKLFIC